MKRFKFLSLALAATAIVSCSSDDLEVASTYVLPDDGTEVFVTIEDSFGGTMRTGFAADFSYEQNGELKIQQQAYFTTGDEFKMYCSDTWKPQVYRFKKYVAINGVNGNEDGAVFEWADPGNEKGLNKGDVTDLTNREYGVYPADAFEFDNENRDHLVFTLDDVELGDYKGTEEEGLKNATGTAETRKVYKAGVPMFGFYNEAANKMTFYYMTSLIRIEMQGMEIGKSHTLELTSTGEKKYKLKGVFESTEFRAADGVNSELPVYNTEVTTTEEEQSLKVTFTPTESDGIVYLPLPTGKYNVAELKLTCKVDKDEAKEIKMYTLEKVQMTAENPYGRKACSDYEGEYNLESGTKLIAFNTKPETVSVASLSDINNLFNDKDHHYADFGRDVTVDVVLTSDILVRPMTSGDYTDVAKKLIIPTLKNNVTLNLQMETGQNYSIKGETGVDKLIICDENTAGTGTLTINLKSSDEESYDAAAIELAIESESNHDIVLGGAFTKAVTFDTDANVGLVGTFSEAVTVTSADNVSLAGTFSGAVKVGTQDAPVNAVVLDGTVSEITSYSTNFTETKDGKIAQAQAGKANINATEAITFGGINGNIIDTYGGNVNVAGNVNYLRNRSGNVTIATEGSVTTLEMIGEGTVTVNGKIVNKLGVYAENTGATVNINNADFNVTTLEVGNATKKAAKATINLNAGNIQGLTNSGTATVITKGAATIGNVTGNTKETPVSITAYWTEDTKALATNVNSGNIYTAAQLAALSAGTVPATVTLYADVKPETGKNIQWSPVRVTSELTFDGGEHTIEGLTVNGGTNAGFFGMVSETLTIKNLMLPSLKVTGADQTGGLVGNIGQNVEVEINKVTINNATISSTGNNVGGLVGVNQGKLTVSESNVTGNVTGGSYVGGLIGGLNTTGETTVSKGNVNVNFALATSASSPVYGTFGVLVGCIRNVNATFTASDVNMTNTINNDKTGSLSFINQISTKGKYKFGFTGSTGNEIGYSVKAGADKVTIDKVVFIVNDTDAGGDDQSKTINYFDTLIQ